MLGLGHLGSSSSSSSSAVAASNLSPLAPPFTVDRSSHNKPNLNSNSVSHFSDPSYSPWPYSHPPAASDFLADSIKTATVTVSCTNDYGYLSPEPGDQLSTRDVGGLSPGLEMNAPGTRWSAVSFSPKPAADSFAYNFGEAKPFYPPYALPVTRDDVSSVALNEPSYDLLSTSDLVHCEGSSRVDYAKNLSGLEYTRWDDSFFSEEANIAASKSYMNQGYGAETLNNRKEDSAMFPGTYVDVFRRESHIAPSVIGKSDCTSSSAKTRGTVPNELLQAPPFVAFPMFSESHPLVPSPEPPKEPWHMPFGKRFDMFDCSNNQTPPSTTKYSPPLVIKTPTAVSTFPAQAPVSNPPSFQIGRFDEHTFVSPFSKKEETSNKLSVNDRLCFEFKARPNYQLSNVDNPDIKDTEYVKSAANSSEHLDHHNPAEDSPCWKKPPTSHFLQFKPPEAESPRHPTKKLQTGNGVNLQVSQADCSVNHSSKVSSSEPHENGDSFEISSAASHTEKENKPGEAAKVNTGGGQPLHDTVSPRNEYGFLSALTNDTDSQTSRLKLPNLKEDLLSCELKLQLPIGDGDDDANIATDGENNVNTIVKALYNLSELLLLHSSNDERALSEQDHKALEHVISKLDACTSKKTRQAQKLTSPQQSASNTFQEGTNETTGMFHGQRMNYGVFGKSVEKLQGYGVPKDSADLLKDRNMVQAIKKVLDDNLECDEEQASQTRLFRNLWLETEAEMCAFSYRARFERMKKEMADCKPDKATDVSEIATVVKTTSSSDVSPDPKTSPKLIHEDDGNKISGTHVKNRPFSSVDDVDASVMARFSILKLRGEPSPVDTEDKEPADDEISGKESRFSGLPPGAFVQHHFGLDNDPEMRSFGNQMHNPQQTVGVDGGEQSVMARLSVLKRRDESNPASVEEQEVPSAEVFVKESQSSGLTVEPHFSLPVNQFDSVWHNASYFASDWEHIATDEFPRRPTAS